MGLANNKRGMVMELIAFAIIGIMVVAFFGIFIYAFNLIHTNMAGINVPGNMVNFTYAEQSTFGNLNTGFGNLKIVAFAIIFAYMISTFIVAYLSTKHPIWIIVYLFVAALITIFSVYLSNAWESLRQDVTLGATFQSFTISDYIIMNLPFFIITISLIGIGLSIFGAAVARRYLEP